MDVKFAIYCKCGMSMKGEMETRDGKALVQMAEEWNKNHSKSGCGPCTGKEAAQVRRKQEREALRRA